MADADRELTALKNEEMALRRSVNSFEQRVENVPKRQEEVQTLSRDYNTTKERYETMLKRYEEAQLAANLEQGQKVEQFRILDAAIPPRDPAAPSRPRLFAIGLFLAIGMAVGAVLLAERIDTAFHNIEDLRAFVSVPTLFSIPLIATAADRRRRWRRLALTTVSVIVGLTLIIAGSHAAGRGNEQIARAKGDEMEPLDVAVGSWCQYRPRRTATALDKWKSLNRSSASLHRIPSRPINTVRSATAWSGGGRSPASRCSP